jgi:hypothetical protein
VGRHRAPLPEGTAPPRAPIALGAGALVVVLVLLVGVFIAVRGSGDQDTVTARPSATPSSKKPSAPTSSTPPSGAATPTDPPSATAPAAPRPRTLKLKMTGASYVTVRLANGRGRILVSRLFHKGQQKTFDQKQLHVLLGNSAAVQVTINGKPRKAGRKGQVATFTARRK